jgi:hypothetical protein
MTEFVKLVFDEKLGHYLYKGAPYSSSIGMEILGVFLAYDAVSGGVSFKQWALNEAETITGSNATNLEKENKCVLLSDIYSVEKKPTKLKISLDQFVYLLDHWNALCKTKQKEVTIKYENGQFVIETSN